MRLLLVAALCLLPLTARAQDGCPSRADVLASLDASIVSLDLPAVPGRLDVALDAFSCGSVASSAQLARMWYAEGVYLMFDGAPDAAVESFQAAKRVAPEVWTTDFGPKMRDAWESAPAAVGQGQVQIDPPFAWWTTWIDGTPSPVPATVDAGLHLVQAGPTEDDIRFAKLLFVRPAGIAIAVHQEQEGLAPMAAAAITESVQTQTRPRLQLHTAVGGGVAHGRALRREPATKLPIVFEMGTIARFPLSAGGARSLWVRASASATPLLRGRCGASSSDVALDTSSSSIAPRLEAGRRRLPGMHLGFVTLA